MGVVIYIFLFVKLFWVVIRNLLIGDTGCWTRSWPHKFDTINCLTLERRYHFYLPMGIRIHSWQSDLSIAIYYQTHSTFWPSDILAQWLFDLRKISTCKILLGKTVFVAGVGVDQFYLSICHFLKHIPTLLYLRNISYLGTSLYLHT